MPTPILYWFRQDLRLADHPGLTAALATGRPVIPVFLWSPQEEGNWGPGGASRWWLHHSLATLSKSLERIGSRLIIRSGDVLAEINALRRETGAENIYWQRRYEPATIQRDTQLKSSLRSAGWQVESFPGALLVEPWNIKNKAGKPFQVFTPYWRHCLAVLSVTPPLPPPTQLTMPATWPSSQSLDSLQLLPTLPWAAGLAAFWKCGETAGAARIADFLTNNFSNYSEGRNRPDLSQTSLFSPHLHFGEITPRQIWHELQSLHSDAGFTGWQQSQFVFEIGWREFAHHLLFHFPSTPEAPLRPEWLNFPIPPDSATTDTQLAAWQQGKTGYPMVDAGMRQLWQTGWMHNRVRMIVASFLTKDLRQPWQRGADWFWDTLVDADLAANTLGWQWTAGCGADASPYYRVFNPTTQGEKFDPQGDYVRRYVPELAKLGSKWIHRPHEAHPSVLAAAGVVLGNNYPHPIVDHDAARKAALTVYANHVAQRKAEASSG